MERQIQRNAIMNEFWEAREADSLPKQQEEQGKKLASKATKIYSQAKDKASN